MRFMKNGATAIRNSHAVKARQQLILLLALAVMPLALFWGCAGAVSGQSTPPPPSGTFSISGTISPTTGGAGATLTLSGASSATTTAGSSGSYSFSGLANGTYAVTPSNSGYAFNPTSQTATINGGNVTSVNFTATAQQTHAVALSWGASTSVVAGYNVYRSTVSGGSYSKVNGSLIPAQSYTDSTVQNGSVYFYVATAVDNSGNESVFSNQVSVNIP